MENNKNLKFKSAYLILCGFAIIFLIFSKTEAQIIKLKYGSYGPKSIIDDPILWYIDEVSKRSGINIKIEEYFGGVLAKAPDCLDALGKGVYDIGWISPALTPGKTPINFIINATPLIVKTLYSGCAAADELVRTFPPAGDEYKKNNLKFLFHTGVWHYTLISTKPVKSIKDIKGLRTRTFGYLSKVWAELGGIPISISIAEAYDALQRGTIDGVLTQPMPIVKSLRLFEIAKHYFAIELGSLPTPTVMNLDVWNKLPEKVRNEMLKLEIDMPKIVDKLINNEELKCISEMKKKGVHFYEPSTEDKARLKEVEEKIIKMITEDLESKGVTNVKEAIGKYISLIRKYSN